MKLFYAIVFVLMIFVSACAQLPVEQQQVQVQPSPEPQTQPETGAVVAVPEEVAEEEVVPETSSTEVTSNEVRYLGSGFEPSELTISAGSSVIWINDDEKPGAVLIFKDGKSFMNSKRLVPEAKFEYEFKEAGEYDFWWNLAFGAESGKIIVR